MKTSKNEPIKMQSEGLNFYYGDFKALNDISLYFKVKEVTALIGPSGCGKSTYLRCLNRMNDLIPISRVEGTVLLDGEDIYAPSVDVVGLRSRIGMVFQKPNPFPKSIFENIAYGLRVNGIKDKAFIAERVETSLKNAALWDEVKDRLNDLALGLSGRPAAAALYRPGAGDRARSDPHGRTLLGPGPHRHPEDRGVDPAAEKRLHYHYRHPQHAAGGPRVGHHGLFLPGQTHRGGRHGHPVYPAGAERNRRLHYRPIRIDVIVGWDPLYRHCQKLVPIESCLGVGIAIGIGIEPAIADNDFDRWLILNQTPGAANRNDILTTALGKRTGRYHDQAFSP